MIKSTYLDRDVITRNEYTEQWEVYLIIRGTQLVRRRKNPAVVFNRYTCRLFVE